MKQYAIDHVNFKVEREDHERLKEVAESLALPKSEIARRALRLGLKRLERSTLPGSRREIER